MTALFNDKRTTGKKPEPSAEIANLPRLGLHPHSTFASGKRLLTSRNIASQDTFDCHPPFSERTKSGAYHSARTGASVIIARKLAAL